MMADFFLLYLADTTTLFFLKKRQPLPETCYSIWLRQVSSFSLVPPHQEISKQFVLLWQAENNSPLNPLLTKKRGKKTP